MVLITLLILALLFVGPLLWLIGVALKTPDELSAYPIRWLPAVFQWENFARALTMIDFWRYLTNTLELATIYASLVTVSSALVGFGFARLRGKGKQLLFLVMLSTIMLPPILTVIPTYSLFTHLQLIDSYWPWVLWGIASTPTITFLFRQHFSTIPVALEEAALLDGASYFHIFWRIFLPLSIPICVTAFILSFTWAWGDYFSQALFLSDDQATLAVAIANGYSDPTGMPFTNILAAGTLLYIVPILILFLFAQRTFVRGIVLSGLK
ncbi:sugar ABC transporter permease [Tengunoibacter tsumagoiensis]|uniref:Sugar ABC transporter permease n=2 Tax=Tengunoibacter tsumagoiensis TaxID=2014871 RepID=A0A402A7J2_9CHLR|nr:sugar ABC transporter permease [Tengunoibacter tsumagoiensis]